MSLTDNILQLRVNLEVSLENSLSIVKLHDNVIEIAVETLANINKLLLKAGYGKGATKNLDHASKMLTNLSKNKSILNQQEVIREQVLVLFIGTLEVYLADLIKIIGNTKPELYIFKDEKEKITFTQDMLKNGFTLGDAILEHITNNKGYSFQDLRSSLEVFKNYLGIEVTLEEESKENLILCAASRHCIVHNMSIVDRGFLRQIRDTRYASNFIINQQLEVNDSLIQNSRTAVLELADQLTAAFAQQD